MQKPFTHPLAVQQNIPRVYFTKTWNVYYVLDSRILERIHARKQTAIDLNNGLAFLCSHPCFRKENS